MTFDEATIFERKRPRKLQLKQSRKPIKKRLLSEIYASTESDKEYYKNKDAQGSDALNETLSELADISHKRKRSLSPSNHSEDRDGAEPGVASEKAPESGAVENASRSSACIPLEENDEAGFASKRKGKRPLYDDDGKKKRRRLTKLSDKFLKYGGGKMQQQKALSNFERGESSSKKGCFWEEMMEHVNQSLDRTVENLRRQFPV